MDVLETVLNDDTNKFGAHSGALALVCAASVLLSDEKAIASIKRDRVLDFVRYT